MALPITIFKNILDEVVKAEYAESDKPITVESRQKVYSLKPSEIIYFEAYGHDVHVKTIYPDSDIMCSTPLRTLEQELQNRYFFRSYNSYLINLRHLKSINSESVIMSNSDKLPLSKQKKRGLKEAYAKYHADIN